jgi:hypothetical protein
MISEVVKRLGAMLINDERHPSGVLFSDLGEDVGDWAEENGQHEETRQKGSRRALTWIN